MRTGVIKGMGSALPEQVLTNADLEKLADTNDEWIVERTGIRERRIGGMTSTLSVEAGRLALERSGRGLVLHHGARGLERVGSEHRSQEFQHLALAPEGGQFLLGSAGGMVSADGDAARALGLEHAELGMMGMLEVEP